MHLLVAWPAGAGLVEVGPMIFDSKKPKATIRNNDIDEGVVAFGLWIKSQEDRLVEVPMSMKKFLQDRLVVLHDRILKKEVAVDILDGVPSCRECNSNDCSHVGFTICAEQMQRRSRLE